MSRYQLAKLVEWAGTLRTRKRLQKVVYLLQATGCPFEAEYTLHHYGPYSQEVARLSDEMVQTGLLHESSEPNARGEQYSYRLAEAAQARLAELEKSPEGRTLAAQLAPFEEKAKELLRADLKELEVAATMVYFRRQGEDWPEAVAKTCRFKELTATTGLVRRAEELARRFAA